MSKSVAPVPPGIDWHPRGEDFDAARGVTMSDCPKTYPPCPLCGAGETLVDEQSYWTGMRNQVLSVTLRHWCAATDDQFIRTSITIRARTEDQAVEAWTRRTA